MDQGSAAGTAGGRCPPCAVGSADTVHPERSRAAAESKGGAGARLRHRACGATPSLNGAGAV